MFQILIAEDEDIIRKGLIYSIPWVDMECTVIGEACNGEEGIQLIQKHRPDIVIADINMPIIDGLEMIRETYEDYDYSAIILSGYSNFEYAQQAIRYGVLEYLLKPLDLKEMKEAIFKAQKDCNVRMAYIQNQRSRDEWRQISLMKDYQKKDDDGITKHMLEFISEHYQKKIIMRDVVEDMNYSETFLNKRFKDSMGTTFIEYLNRYRIQKALELLQEGSLSIQDVSWKCGIGDYKYFGAVFKKYIGCSPKEYVYMVREK